MVITPVVEATETLVLSPEVTETLVAFGEGAETLTPLPELIRSSQFVYPASFTYPSATTWPGQYGLITGHAFGLLAETPESLTPLVEA